jgi:hypothetical protein
VSAYGRIGGGRKHLALLLKRPATRAERDISPTRASPGAALELPAGYKDRMVIGTSERTFV